MIRTICLTLVLVCFCVPGSNFAAPPCPTNSVNESTLPQSRRTSELAMDLANHVIALIENESSSSRDRLSQEARKLRKANIQKQLRYQLEYKLGGKTGYDREDEFKRLLEEVDATLTPAKQAELRRELRSGGPKTHGWPWPLCVIGGCR